MEEFQSYSPEEIILSNLNELRCRSMQVHEQLVAHLCELATEIADGFSDPVSFLASLPEHRLLAPRGRLYTDSPTRAYAFAYSTYERALLCIELRKRIPLSDIAWNELFFPSGDTEVDRASANRISYQKNNYTDEAFGCFSQALGGARVSYVSEFSAVCENICNGVTEYGILPIESSEDGRLWNFARLIARFNLKIAATCDVRAGGDRVTRFALLRRNLLPPNSHADVPRLFEGSCDISAYPSAQDLLEAARICGLETERADLKRSENGDKQMLHVTLSTDQGDLPAFLLYLSMEVPSFHIIGYYSNYTI